MEKTPFNLSYFITGQSNVYIAKRKAQEYAHTVLIESAELLRASTKTRPNVQNGGFMKTRKRYPLCFKHV